MPRFYHGTVAAFARHAREVGLHPPPGHGRGVRLNRSPKDAREYARMYAAGIAARTLVVPQGAILVIDVPDTSRIRTDTNGVLRCGFVRKTEILQVRGPINFESEFGSLEVGKGGPTEAFWDACQMYEDVTAERLNMPFPRRRVRRR